MEVASDMERPSTGLQIDLNWQREICLRHTQSLLSFQTFLFYMLKAEQYSAMGWIIAMGSVFALFEFLAGVILLCLGLAVLVYRLFLM